MSDGTEEPASSWADRYCDNEERAERRPDSGDRAASSPFDTFRRPRAPGRCFSEPPNESPLELNLNVLTVNVIRLVKN